MWVSAVGGSGRRAVILRARMMGIIEASVHEREPRFFSKDQQNVQERMAHLHVSPDGQTFHLKLNGCSRMEPGQECRALQRCRCVMP